MGTGREVRPQNDANSNNRPQSDSSNMRHVYGVNNPSSQSETKSEQVPEPQTGGRRRSSSEYATLYDDQDNIQENRSDGDNHKGGFSRDANGRVPVTRYTFKRTVTEGDRDRYMSKLDQKAPEKLTESDKSFGNRYYNSRRDELLKDDKGRDTYLNGMNKYGTDAEKKGLVDEIDNKPSDRLTAAEKKIAYDYHYNSVHGNGRPPLQDRQEIDKYLSNIQKYGERDQYVLERDYFDLREAYEK